jgi:site-specific recombinase XerD
MSDVSPTLPQCMKILEGLLQAVDIELFNGAAGTNREIAEHCQIKAVNDYQAIYAWLAEYKESPETYRSYRREAERLLLWCLLKQKKALSSLQRDDIDDYKQFLIKPEPQEFWCWQGGKQVKRGASGWKPFKAGLSAASLKTAINIINSLLQYLVDAEYLRRNPMQLMRKRVRESETMEAKSLKRQEKILSPRQWTLLIETLESLPEKNYSEKREKHRTKMIIAMSYYMGLRVSDLVNAKWSDFKTIHDNWWFEVTGKGGKHALLPVSIRLLEQIKSYREFFSLPLYPKQDEEMSVLRSWRSGGSIRARQVNNVLKSLALKTLERIKPEHDDLEKFTAFSAHKIRHVMGSDLARDNLSTDIRKQLMRHAKIETTLEYSHLTGGELHSSIEKISLSNLN